jgi:hypothetical protein
VLYDVLVFGRPQKIAWLLFVETALTTIKKVKAVRLTGLLTYMYELFTVTALLAYVVVPEPTPK